jgi:ABC-type Fe3+/spermidine/putrescine transport system ATPase subunit
MNVSSISRYGEVINPEVYGLHAISDPRQDEGAIVVEDLVKSFNGVEILKGVSLSIRPGDFATILGPSGSGKTTILRCLAGLEDPDRGRIYLNGKLVFDAEKGINSPTHRRRLGMIFQNYALWPHMTVLQHVLFPLKHRGEGKNVEKAREALKLVDLTEHADKFPHQLSGGQQQRVAVARAIVADPKVLLMDEPLSNLDVQLRRQLRDELKAAHLRCGATSVFVTHDQAQAFALSDYLIVMRDGKIEQQDIASNLRLHPRNVFIAEFLGYENLISGQDLRRICSAVEGTVEPGAHYAVGATALRPSDPKDGDCLRIDGCVLDSSSYDGLIHTHSFTIGDTRLEVKALEDFYSASQAGPMSLWLKRSDIIRIEANN